VTSLLRRSRNFAGFIPAGVLYGVFFGVPLLLIVMYSFWNVVDYEVVRDWSLDNYTYLLSVANYNATLVATFWTSAVVTVIALVAAFPVAYWLNSHVRPQWQRPLLAFIVVPFLASYLLRVYAWVTILDENGVVSRLLKIVGLGGESSGLLYNRGAVIAVLVYMYFPFAVLTLYAPLRNFDMDQLSAAMDLGASRARAIASIMLPQIRPGIATAAIFVFVPVLGEYLVPQLIGGTTAVMYGNLTTTFFQGGEYTRGAAAAMLIAVVIVGLLVVFRRTLELRGTDVTSV
jgi:spermidine/putrescine transport system permease protein